MKDVCRVTLCLSYPHPEYVCSINDCQTLHWTTKNCRGGGAASRDLGAVTDGRASLLFLKLGEFFPGSVIRILMVSREMEPLVESPRLLGVIWTTGGSPTSHYSKTSSHSIIIFMRNFPEQNVQLSKKTTGDWSRPSAMEIESLSMPSADALS